MALAIDYLLLIIDYLFVSPVESVESVAIVISVNSCFRRRNAGSSTFVAKMTLTAVEQIQKLQRSF